MARFCGNCGTALGSTAIFCGGCGTRVPAAAPAPEVVTSAPVPAISDAGFAQVPASFAPVPEAAADAASFAPVPAYAQPAYAPPAYTPAPAVADAGFTSVPAAFPPPPAPVPPPVAPAAAAPVNIADFVPRGGTSVPYTQTPTAYVPAQAAAAPAAVYPATAYPATAYPAAAYPPAKSNLLLKLLIAFVLIIFVGGALAVGGLWYAAQKIRAKAHDVAAKISAENPSASSTLGGLLGDSQGSSQAADSGDGGFTGDPCRFLTKAEVGGAIGVPILRTEATDGGCSYIGKGDPADVTAKHMSAMLAGMGASPEAQKMAQKFAGGLFAQQEATDKDLSAQAAKGEVPLLTLAFTAGHAAAEMKANRAGLAHINAIGPAGTDRSAATAGGDLPGIGDEAYAAAGSMILLRKGNVMARMMYVSCPCNTDTIKPLARILASRL